MAAAKHTDISFRLLKKTYEIRCPADRQDAFDQAVKLFKTRIQKVHKNDPGAAMDRIAVIAALNLSHDYQQLQDTLPQDSAKSLQVLSEKIQTVLDAAQEMNQL